MANNSGFGIVLLIAVVIGLFYFFNQDSQEIFSVTSANIKFAGFTWTDLGNKFLENGNLIDSNSCGQGGGTSKVERIGEFLQFTSNGNNNRVVRVIETNVKDIDEILVVYEGSAQTSCVASKGNTNSVIFGGIRGSNDDGTETPVMSSESISTTLCPSSSQSLSRAVAPSIWKFRNNFDGTWSSLQGLGVGDIFIEKGRANIDGDAILRLGVTAGSGCGTSGSGIANLKVYNVVVKENSFAVCKADEFWQDLNGDGTPQTNECFDLQTIVLNSEEAIKESIEEKFQRIKDELLQKEDGLDKTLIEQQLLLEQLQKQLSESEGNTALAQKVLNLEEELKKTRLELQMTQNTLKSVESRDKDVINTIENQEKFIDDKQSIPTPLLIVLGAVLVFIILRIFF